MRAGPVVVCGAGAAGMATALAAARGGAPVVLVEAGNEVGGTVANALIHTLGGLYDGGCQPLNGGLANELTLRLQERDAGAHPRRIGRVWVLVVRPDLYREVVRGWLALERHITLLTRAHVDLVEGAAGRVERVRVKAQGGEAVTLHPRALVDATGTGEVVRLLRPELAAERWRAAAGGLIFAVRGVDTGALAFPKGIGLVRALRERAGRGELPPRCRFAWLDQGVRPDEVYVKLFVPLGSCWRERREWERINEEAHAEAEAVLRFLQSQQGFTGACVAAMGALGIRDGGQVVGEYELTETDVRSARRFADGICRCAWPVEYWDPERGVSLEYLPEGSFYEIPLRALKVRGWENLWAPGKCLSADAKAQASARVAGSCWAMGEAVGRAAVNN